MAADTQSSMSSYLRALQTILPRVPVAGKAALSHALGWSEHSKEWDLRTAVTILVLRSFIVDSPPTPIARIQRLSQRVPPIKGRIWVSQVTAPVPPEDDVRQALFKAIEGLRTPDKNDETKTKGYTEPELLPVEAEWTGYRAGATRDSPPLKCSEEEIYKEMMREATSPTTILYFHGGAHYLMDPATHRPTCKKLAKLTKGRCFNVRYRLSPQNPFPAALLDALLSYLYLLYPPPSSGAFHTPVSPSHIVFAGDSAGGNICLALLQLLLEIQRQNLRIRWHGEDREVPLPAGVAMCSPWADVTHSSPSCETNAPWDYLPPQSTHKRKSIYPSDSAWPTDPPRKNLYAEDEMLVHPLVSPLAARSWRGSCPLYIDVGQELLADEGKHVAAKAAREGVSVIFEEYQAMPHCFAMMLQGIPGAKRFFDGWAAFCRQVVEEPGEVRTKGTYVRALTLEEEKLDVEGLATEDDEVVVTRMRERIKYLRESNPDTIAKL